MFKKKPLEAGPVLPNVIQVEEHDPFFNDFKATFQSSIFRLGLLPSERNHVLFVLFMMGDKKWDVLPAGEMIPIEYLLDFFNAAILAMKWVSMNCDEEKTEDGRHLYFKFRENKNGKRPV